MSKTWYQPILYPQPIDDPVVLIFRRDDEEVTEKTKKYSSLPSL